MADLGANFEYDLKMIVHPQKANVEENFLPLILYLFCYTSQSVLSKKNL